MRCRRSFFSPALFRKNLARFWPLWGMASLAGAMPPLWIVLELVSRSSNVWRGIEAAEFAQQLCSAAAYVAPYITVFYAILCAMLVWGYLMNGRALGLMHTLPVDRTCLFITGTLSGLAMMLIPFAVSGALLCAAALIWGFMDFGAVCLTALSVILLSVLYFGMATLCAMVTGNIFAVPVLYVLLNFIAPLTTLLFNSLYTQFFLGVPGTQYEISSWLSPPIKIAQRFQVLVYRADSGAVESVRLEGLGIVALYALAGVLMLALSWLLYRLRHSETAGDVMVFPWLRPVFRYGVAALSALSVGRVFYSLFWQETFQVGSWYDAAPMGVCLALAGILGYYAASMLLEKSLRVFRGSWKGVAIVCGGVLALSLWLRFDLSGMVRRVPEAADVAKVSVSFSGGEMTLVTGEDQALIEDVAAFHRAVVDDRAYIMEHSDRWTYAGPYDADSPQRDYVWVELTYQLQNGSTLRRRYSALPVRADRAERADTYDGKLAALMGSRQAALGRFSVGEDWTLDDMSLYRQVDDNYRSDWISTEDWERVYDALMRDWEAGRVPGYQLFGGSPDYYRVDLEMEFQREDALDAGNRRYSYKETPLFVTMTDTIGALEALGYVSEEDLALWREDLAARTASMSTAPVK